MLSERERDDAVPRAWDRDFDARVLFALVRGQWLGRPVRLTEELGCDSEDAGAAVRRLRRWGCRIEGDPHVGRWLVSLPKKRPCRTRKSEAG